MRARRPPHAIALTACLLLASSAAAQLAPTGERSAGLREPAAAESRSLQLHVLNRLTYGPTDADWREMRQGGATAFIRRQLSPEAIDDGTRLRDRPPLERGHKHRRSLAG